VALSIETSMQLGFPLNDFSYYFLSVIASVFYYNYPYVRKYSDKSTDSRTIWYRNHYSFLRWNQLCLGLILAISMCLFLYQYEQAILHMNVMHWFLVFIFPLVAFMYYGINFFSTKYNLRKIGWLKPFIIGFTWAGMVTVYPILYHDIIHYHPCQLSFFEGLLFLKNLMFISVLGMMFDIKDYAGDKMNNLNTFVVKIGLKKTILYILFPLPLLGLLTFLSYATMHHFHLLRMVLIMIPFFLLLLAANSLRKKRTMLYYLIVIDGLMVVKAIFGIAAMLV
jgi:4-hydroxybenzoate polyprenyltransferase